MDRRSLLALPGIIILAGASLAHAQGDPLKALLAEVESDPGMVKDGLDFTEPTVSRGVGHGVPSRRRLVKDATDVIIAFEVASPKVYERLYRHPVVPGEKSGVTVGVGYDLRFANHDTIERDWPMLSATDRAKLLSAIAVYGPQAEAASARIQSVDIPWLAAKSQFDEFIRYPTKQTEDAFPNCGDLNDLSFGALVSLVYNRGPQIPARSQQRREMREIRDRMSARDYAPIPDLIRSMKRIWADNPKARGLLRRREAEALLFAKGLPNHPPSHRS